MNRSTVRRHSSKSVTLVISSLMKLNSEGNRSVASRSSSSTRSEYGPQELRTHPQEPPGISRQQLLLCGSRKLFFPLIRARSMRTAFVAISTGSRYTVRNAPLSRSSSLPYPATMISSGTSTPRFSSAAVSAAAPSSDTQITASGLVSGLTSSSAISSPEWIQKPPLKNSFSSAGIPCFAQAFRKSSRSAMSNGTASSLWPATSRMLFT